MSVHTVTSENSLRQYLGDNLVVVDASASFCQPCRLMAPKFAQLATDYPNVTFVKFDVDEAPDLASQYNITAMPTFLFIKNGQVIDKVIGADYTKLVRTIKANL